MAERNDWDRNRDREQEIDRERGGYRLDTQRNRESRGFEGGRWEDEGGGRYGAYDRERESEGRGNYPRYEDRTRDYERDYRGEDFRRERAEWGGGSRPADFGERGDWGRQGSWGTYGNRPNYDERSRYTGQWASGQSGGGGQWRRERERENEGMQHNQMGGMSGGRSSGMWTSGAGGGYGAGYTGSAGGFGGSRSSYGGGMGSFSGGLGGHREQGRFTGRGPKNWQRSDERIREEVNERLTDHPDIDAFEIEVQVKNAEVTLTGTVEDRHTKRLAEDVAENVSGVREVHNQLRTHSGAGTGTQWGAAAGSEIAHSASLQSSGTTTPRK